MLVSMVVSGVAKLGDSQMQNRMKFQLLLSLLAPPTFFLDVFFASLEDSWAHGRVKLVEQPLWTNSQIYFERG